MKKNNCLFWIPLMLTLPVMAAIFLHFFPLVSTSNQVFSDIIIENVARSGLNKSGELTLFWLILAGGLLLLLFLHFTITQLLTYFSMKHSGVSKKASLPRLHQFSTPWKKMRYALILLLPNLCHYVIYKEYSLPLLLLSLIYLCASFVCTRYAKEILVFYVLTYYAYMGIWTILVQISDQFLQLNRFLWFFFATALTLLLFFRKKLDFFKPILLWLQFPILGVFALYFVDTYLYQGTEISLPFAPGYYVFFVLLLLLLFGDMLYHLIRFHKNAIHMEVEKLIYISTVISIFVYNSFSACPMFAQPDQHHHGEQMIPWQQVITLGQNLYEEYTPVSGLFPFVIGAIQHLLLGGSATDYSPAVSIMMVVFSAITMYLIYQHVGGVWSLAFGLLFSLPSYNRQYLILPILLLLMLPKLIAQKRVWLFTWIFSCFLAGLYYPLYGGALLIATLPFGILQFIDWCKGKKDWKNPIVFIEILAVFLPIIASIPLLFRMLNHTLTYSSQTVLADGINLYGQSVPADFLPYLLEHEYLRSCIYFSLRFLLPAIGVWAFAYLLYHLLFVYKKTGVTFIQKCRSQLFLGLTGGLGTLCISYTYTLVRADTDVLLSRTSYILCAIFGMLFPLILLNGQKQHRSFSMIVLLAISFSIPMLLYRNVSDMKFPDMWVYPNGESALYLDDTAKLYSSYEVPETFLKAEDTGLADTSTLGRGFMVADQLGYIENYARVIDKCNRMQPETYYMGLDGQGFFYYNNVKACSTGFIQAGKGYEAQQEVISLAQKERPVIFLMEPECTYYVYYWMHTNDYVYSSTDECFFPVELFEKLYPDSEPDDYRYVASPTDFGLVADSFGASMESLAVLMTDKTNLPAPVTTDDLGADLTGSITYTFDTPLSGKDFDMLYLKLDTTKLIQAASDAGVSAPSTLQITFEKADKEPLSGASVSCAIGDGALLIPMGMNPCWLLTEDITKITIHFDCALDGDALSSCITESMLAKIRQ